MAHFTYPPVPNPSVDFPHLQTARVKFRRILVPIDFSAPAERALEMAIRIAELYASEILIAHASYPATYYAGEGIVAGEFLVDCIGEDKKFVETILARHPAPAQVKVETVVEYADPVTLIRQLTDKFSPDLVLVGSHSSSKIEQLAIGSVAQSVVYSLTTPVLIMGPCAEVPEQLFRSIVLATDLSTIDLRAAQYASSLCEELGGTLTLLHVVHDPPRDARTRKAIENRLSERLRLLIPENSALSSRSRARIEYGEAAEQILNVAKSGNANLVVMGARRGSMVADHAPWATLSKVIHSATCGVLVIRGHLA